MFEGAQMLAGSSGFTRIPSLTGHCAPSLHPVDLNPYSVLLDSVPWQLFLTGTLCAPEHREGWDPVRDNTSLPKIRVAWWNYWALAASKFGNVHPKNSRHYGEYFVRLEQGEEGGRWHLHALIYFSESKRMTKSFRFANKALWSSINGHGMARTRQVIGSGDDSLQQVALSDYVTKLEENRYEGSKFPGAEQFIISPRLLQGIGTHEKCNCAA